MRLECISPWVREWALPEMHAGVPEMGAVDAWYEVLTTLEEHKFNGKQFVGGVADIAKFFDQIRRELVYRTCEAAGMPTGVLRAYTAYLENLKVYNCVAGGMGTPYIRTCGIPQGCPFSMMNVALIMKPWIRKIRKFTGTKCYILADDVLIIGTGVKMPTNFAGALNATHKYLHSMGAKVAPDKSYNFASNLIAKRWLEETIWEHIESGIQVITDFRYLGAHLTTRHAASSSTLDKRWEKAKQQLKKLRFCPAKTEAKVRAIICKIYASAMYGVEVAVASPAKVASLTAVVIDVFKSRNNVHNANQFFTTITGNSNDLDPQVQIFARRVLQVRRALCKKPEAARRVMTTLETYANKNKRNGKWPSWYSSTNDDDPRQQQSYPSEQPHPSTGEHEAGWDDDILAMGPIGLLIESLTWHGMKIDSDLNVWQRKRGTDKHTASAVPKPQTAHHEGSRKS